MCSGCARPASVCVCASVVRVTTRTRVVILQHPRERDVPIGTARLAELGLPNAERHVGVDFSSSERLHAILGDRAAPPILLWPGDGAANLAEAPPAGPVTLIVIDGTWSQAKKLVRRNPALAALPRFALAPGQPSRYRIRREPALHCVSTIEAIALALGELERDTPGIEGILQPFESMVEHQLRFAREHRAHRHLKTARPVRARRWPEALVARANDLVVGYAEANAWPRGTPLGAESEIVHLVAERVTSGDRFEAFIAPRRPLSPSFRHHTELAPESVLGAGSWGEFLARWQAFLKPTDVLGGWGYFWSEALRREGAPVPERVDLRLVARQYLRARTGDVEQCARALGATRLDAWAAGRTGRRAAGITAIARALLQLARAEPATFDPGAAQGA